MRPSQRRDSVEGSTSTAVWKHPFCSVFFHPDNFARKWKNKKPKQSLSTQTKNRCLESPRKERKRLWKWWHSCQGCVDFTECPVTSVWNWRYPIVHPGRWADMHPTGGWWGGGREWGGICKTQFPDCKTFPVVMTVYPVWQSAALVVGHFTDFIVALTDSPFSDTSEGIQKSCVESYH